MPGKDLPHNDWLNLLQADKFIHISFYFILALMMLNGLRHQFRLSNLIKYNIIIFIFCAFIGMFLEILQGLFTERHFDMMDIIANMFGAIVAIKYFSKITTLNIFRIMDNILFAPLNKKSKDA